ncbi:MAG: hypothetical protein NTZ90_16245 [Proteobacteria bacterium]|nr:hypothetical protein [Pseudomonadota bacterium]
MYQKFLFVTGIACSVAGISRVGMATEESAAKAQEVQCAVYDVHGQELVPETAISSKDSPYHQSLVVQSPDFRYQVELRESGMDLILNDQRGDEVRVHRDGLAVAERVSLALVTGAGVPAKLTLNCIGTD